MASLNAGQKLHASTATVTGSEKPRNHFCNSAGWLTTGPDFRERPVASSAVM